MQGYQDFYFYQNQGAAKLKSELQHFAESYCDKIKSTFALRSGTSRINLKSKQTQFFVVICVYLSAICLHGCQ